MKEGWEYKKFESCLAKVPKQVQVKSKDYKKTGRFPIVSQESELISGYWDDETIVYKHNEPVIIFGDHTKNIKYIDFDFVVGADGTHILSTKDDIIAKYFFYALKSVKLRNLGYARHYKLLKEKYIPVPPLSEQQRIVDYFDAAFAKIDAMKANAEKALNEAKALFQASLKEMLEPKEGWEEKKMGEICKELFSGGDAPKGNMTKKPTKDYNIPIYANAAELEGLYGYTNFYRVNEPSVTIAARGSGTGLVIKRKNAYLPIVRLIVAIPKSFLSVDYLYFALQVVSIKSNGSAIPQLTVPAIKQYKLCFPPKISEQQSIVATLDSLKSKVDHLQVNFEKISQECDALKQAILRKVFE